jgi:uncharacterized protein
MSPVTLVIKKCHTVLEEHYGTQLKGLILYGSMARKRSSPESDIDLLVLLDPPFDYFLELRRIIDMLYPLQLESEQLISAKPVMTQDFDLGRLSMYRVAKREGIRV